MDGVLSALVQPVTATDISIGPGSGSPDPGAGPIEVNSMGNQGALTITLD